MSTELTDLPDWVWNLLDAIERYEDEHPILYRLGSNDTDGALAYERALCFGGYLGEHNAWPPREVTDAAHFRRHILASVATEKETP